MWRKFSILTQPKPFWHFLSHYRESADFRQKEEALMLQIHCCNGKVNMINLNTKRKHGETAKHCAFKDGQFNVIP